MKEIREFILWNNCNNNCTFCPQRSMPSSTKEQKIQAISLVLQELHKLGDSHLLFVGGELFYEKDTNVKLSLLDLYHYALNKLKDSSCFIYINTNLLYEDTSLLFSVLEMFKESDMLHRIKFTTSDDWYGRFNDSNRGIFKRNLKSVVDYGCNVVVNTIMSDEFVHAILDGTYNIKNYCDKYGVYVNTIPLIALAKTEAPTRSDFWKAIGILDSQIYGYQEAYCANFALNQEVILKQFQDGKLIDVSAPKNPDCDHPTNFTKCYEDSNNCFKCDCERIL